MKVIELSRQGCISPHVVRFYVRKGLLSPDRHPHNGYRIFQRDHLARIRLIRSLQALGFTLDEINKAIQEEGLGRTPIVWMHKVLIERVQETDLELKALSEKRERMAATIARLHCGEEKQVPLNRLSDLVRELRASQA